MKKIIILFLVLTIFSSCRRNFATFQPSHYESFESEKSLDLKIQKEKSQKEIDKSIYNNYSKSNDNIEIKEERQLVKQSTLIQTNQKATKQDFRNNTTTNSTKIKKQNRRRDNWWENINVRLKIGAVLLGIAIIFAILSIEVLAIVFGLVAAYMIIRGLRKMW
jgi:Flp pilus assembly protein TadB